jgi:hypothetical protein
MTGFIKCPECKAEIPLTDVIDHEIHEQLEVRLADERMDRERSHAAALEERERELRAEFEDEQRVREERAKQFAEEQVATEVADLQTTLQERSVLLKQAQERELALRRDQRKLQEEREALELNVARRVDGERKQIVTKAREDLIEAHQLELREKGIELEQMQRQIKELQESSQQRRSGLRGEALEREIEDILRERFAHDRIEPIKAGTRGADVLQTVHLRGRVCGKILWESKRARNFSNNWITKLKQDQSSSDADFAVLVCASLPPHIRLMEQVEGVWIIEPACVPALATALRDTLGLISQARSVDANRNDAMDAIYNYLSSPAFARRIRKAVETFIEMKKDLDLERRSMETRWSKRDTQLDQLALNTAGMYGELEALMGSALPPVDLLELPPPTALDVAARPAA